ncbi:unnamed protein product [Anisakis simplex]|uniref:Splicing factor 1 (inferred by orthology to a human protein) n=1 Tax=Anisakis simplex TaxID=6269 RepID=A0A0M3JGD7_ANISI|nr:unnamed protein product [Anisakis simplex]
MSIKRRHHLLWECPDAPNVTASIVCTACGAAGHIAKDCKNPRPGGTGAFGLNAGDGGMDDEYSALMEELGEKQPAKPFSGHGGKQGGFQHGGYKVRLFVCLFHSSSVCARTNS